MARMTKVPGLEIRLTPQFELEVTVVNEAKLLIYVLGEYWDRFMVKERVALCREIEALTNGKHPLQEKAHPSMHGATDDAGAK